MVNKLLSKIFEKLGQLADWSSTRGHLAFALYFAIFGSVLQWHEKLDINYLGLIAAIQAFLLGHQVKDAMSEFFAKKSDDTKPA